ncbi:MAG: ferric reductase-like transmembrane domain-containing protein [Candidatus Accumulibacter sp.]|jgi:predicted ferric reductase|nr:ferric reductase-like transmembrane domain-containing protein [Accumulibacter sp.]
MKRFLLPVTALVIVVWAAQQPEEILHFSAAFSPMRRAFIVLTGALTLSWMSFCMVLALRPVWLERALGGLDKLYAAHKRTGIGAMALLAVHWLLELSPPALAFWGWIGPSTRPQTPGRLLYLGHEFGEWAGIALLSLGVISLLRSISYGWFRKLHKAFPIVFLIGAAHTVIMLFGTELLASPFGALALAVCAAGGAAAVISLVGLIGRRRRHLGHVAETALTDAGVFDLSIDPGTDWPGHMAGQFALLTFDSAEGAHPFTIASAWYPGASLRFAIKALGDYTRTLPGEVRPGDAVIIEGPYGRFDFGEISEDQVWIAGGVGIVPFLARLEVLAAASGVRGKVHLFYSARNFQEASFPCGLEALCCDAGVKLHLHINEHDGRMGVGNIGELARQAQSVWFCGPKRWGRKLRAALRRDYGLEPEQFHSELFQFR